MWNSRFSRATHGGRSHMAVAVALLMCVGLVACTAAEAPSPASTTEAEAVVPLPEPAPGGDPEDVDAGTYVVTGFTVPFQITVPEGWKTFGWGVLKEEAGEWGVFVNFNGPESVPTDACQWRGAFVNVDPSPEAYVDAMAAQTSSQTTPPVEVVMGDYSGYEFDYARESDIDNTDCDVERVCLFSGLNATECGRTHEGVHERETERVLDLNGELAMIAVGQFKEVDPALTAEARAVFDSIEFESSD